jgi:ferrochelatase
VIDRAVDRETRLSGSGHVSGTVPYDALLLVSFGGPEGMADVSPFLDQVLRGRNVPPERRREVTQHYERFGGVSPINGQSRALQEALRAELAAHGPRLPLYWGNRNWHPFLADTLRAMAGDGVRRALAFVTSAYSSYSGCRQYLEDIARARAEVGPSAPVVEKLRAFHDHPGFVEANVERVREALQTLPADRRAGARIAFTAHSIPLAMATGSDYVRQLREACGLVAARVPHARWALAYQSRSGSPREPWLEPDILDHLDALRAEGVADVVVAPVGFVSDHMEVVHDLDTEARERAAALGLGFVRAGTAGTHPAFVGMVRELIEERVAGGERRALGAHGPRPDTCAPDCCPSGPARPPAG